MSYSEEFLKLTKDSKEFIASKEFLIPSSEARQAIQNWVAVILEEAYLRGQRAILEGH